MFTGDSVLGASSTSVRHLSSYIESLKLISSYPHDTICPAHGPVVPPPRGAALVEWQINHRLKREEQILGALQKGFNTASSIALEIYPRDLDEKLRSSAEFHEFLKNCNSKGLYLLFSINSFGNGRLNLVLAFRCSILTDMLTWPC